jgi:hypothetical protein
MAWILDAVGCSFSRREGSAGPPLKNVMNCIHIATFTFLSIHAMHQYCTRIDASGIPKILKLSCNSKWGVLS